MTDKTIVLGDDGSEGADLAWQWLMLHRWPGWRVDVVTATEAFSKGVIASSDAPLKEWDPPARRVATPHSSIGAVRHLTKTGDPRMVLDECRDVSLLVLGAVGLGSLKTVLMGSTADWFLHQPSAPLALVRCAAPTETVIFCVDGSPHAQRAVEVAAALPWINTVRAQLLTVDDGRADNEVALRAAMDTLRSVGVDAETIRERGRPTYVIMEALAGGQDPPPLVVLGTRGLTTLRRLWLGSTAAAIARHHTGNVIVASEGAASA
ncbi:MAG: universal stress protein [Acidimicrobiales bacterium]